MYRILIVEDDSTIAKIIKKHLVSWGYEAYCSENFQNIIEDFLSSDPQLVLLDLSLPFYNGFHWCQEIRKISKIPIIFISSASDNMNIVMAMNMGGDDFIAKPFDLNVLTAKIQAILRRSFNDNLSSSSLEYRGAVLNTDDASLKIGDSKIELTKNEYRILKILMENKGKIISRDTLMRQLWETDCFVDENTLSVNVARLRKKLEGFGLSDFIKTKKGLGYIIE